MGKKRHRQDEPIPEDAGPPEDIPTTGTAAAETYVQDGEEAWGGQRGKRSKSLVNPETATYLEEVVAHFKTLVDDDERSLLVGNVLEEIAGKEVKVSGDPVCSRYVETLMAAAQTPQLLKFLTSVADVDGFFSLVSSPFGSHVVEKLIVRLESQLDAMSQDEYDEFQRLLTMLTDSICPHLYDYVTDRYATHVVRRLLCLLAGRNILPPPGKQQQQQQQLLLAQEGNKRSKADPPSGLAAKLAGGAVPSAGAGGGRKGGGAAAAAMAADLLGLGGSLDEAPPARMPELVAKIVGVVCSEEYVGPTVSELVYHTYACPFLQALLRAASSDRKLLRQLVPVLLGASTFNDSAKSGAAALFEGCKDDEVAAMLTDPNTSHLVEVVLQVLPRPLFEEFFKRFMSGRLADLAHHPSANFVVQAALAAAPSKDVAKSMFEALSGLLPDLLRKRRSGVVAALVACCGRHGVCQKEVCAALAAALSGLPQWANLKGDAALAPALLCLDSVPVVGSNEPFSAATVAAARVGGNSLPRLSPVGCSILIQVLRYGQGACRAFTDSVAALQPNDAARVGADPAGSRVLEALLEGNAPAKVKACLLSALSEHWDAVAATAPGSFLVETAYRCAEPAAKEAIVSRLATAIKSLEVTRWGPALLSRVGVESYTRDPEQWRRHAASASKTLSQFAKLFGAEGEGGGGHGGAVKGGKGEGVRDKSAGKGRETDMKADADEGPPRAEANHVLEEEKKKKKREKSDGKPRIADGTDTAEKPGKAAKVSERGTAGAVVGVKEEPEAGAGVPGPRGAGSGEDGAERARKKHKKERVKKEELENGEEQGEACEGPAGGSGRSGAADGVEVAEEGLGGRERKKKGKKRRAAAEGELEDAGGEGVGRAGSGAKAVIDGRAGGAGGKGREAKQGKRKGVPKGSTEEDH